MAAVSLSPSRFAASLTTETAFDVLAVARRLQQQGKDVIALQIGDSPFPSTRHAREAGIAAIEQGLTRYCPSQGLLEFRAAIAANYQHEFGIPITAEHVVVGPGAKVFEQFFCELFVEPGDAVLLFDPCFPTFAPNLERRGGRIVTSPLRQEQEFRPNLADVEQFLTRERSPRAIFLNSPHNPTGGVALEADLQGIAELIRGKNIAVFSDEPYCHMVWTGQHRSILSQPGMLEQCVAAYTFSKSYSMSGWRIGYAITSPPLASMITKMINTALSCVPPLCQMAAKAALEHDAAERDATMKLFEQKVRLLVDALRQVPQVSVLMPAGTFYVFPNVAPICARLGITSHGLAMYLLEAADDQRGVACLGGECFGPAGQGFLRFSCAEPDERLLQAVDFFAEAITRTDRVAAYLQANPKYRPTPA